MPTLQYRCEAGHTTDQFFRSISAGVEVAEIQCPQCHGTAVKIFSVPLSAHFYGDPTGYSRPSPTKRFNTKTVSQKDGNKNAIG